MASVRIATALAVVLAAPNLIFDEVTASDGFSEAYKYTVERRHLQTCTRSDDALDPTPVKTKFFVLPFVLPFSPLWLALLAQ